MSGKKYADAAKKFDRDQLFTPAEALAMVKSLASANFDETVEFAVRLGVDPRKADQMVRGTVALPSGTGRAVRVAVFAAGEAAQAARDAAEPAGRAAPHPGDCRIRDAARRCRSCAPWRADRGESCRVSARRAGDTQAHPRPGP